MIIYHYLPLLLNLKLLSTKGDPILPNVGSISFGSKSIPDPAYPLTARSKDFSYFLSTQFGIVVHKQATSKSLFDYEHNTRILFRLPNPRKAYELAMLKSQNAFSKFGPRQHPYCQLNSDKSYKKYFSAHSKTLDNAWKDELELAQLDQSGRQKKQALLAAGLGALIGFYGISHYAHTKFDENYQNTIQRELTEFDNSYKQSEKRVMDVEVHNVNAIHEYFCSLAYQNYKVTSPKLAELAVDKYVNSLEHTINNALNDRLPISQQTIKSLLTLCKQVNSASSLPFSKIKSLCAQDVRTNMNERFMGFEVDGSDILLHFDVVIRSYSDVQISSIFSVYNLGYFNNTSRFTLNLPSFIYRTNTGKFVQISDDFDSLHKPQPASAIKSTCAGSLFVNDKQKFQTCLDKGRLRFIEEPLNTCKYLEVGSSSFLVAGPGRFYVDTDIRLISENSIVPPGSFECDLDSHKVTLNKLTQNEIEFQINQLDNRLLQLVPVEPLPNLVYPTTPTIELEQPQVHLHHVNFALCVTLALLFGVLVFGMCKMRGNILALLQKTEQTNEPDNDTSNRLNTRKCKSLNDIEQMSNPESATSE